jgi:L-2-hydroxyglutarate oxidase LhgO
MERLDCVVIGAGVVGLAIAREMALQRNYFARA